MAEINSGDDSTFSLNLAPMLDIIVSVVPMLLLSVVFIKINTIESPLPQAVKDALAAQKQEKSISIALDVSKQSGFDWSVTDGGGGVIAKMHLPLKNGAFDMTGLAQQAVEIKRQHPEVFRLDLKPEGKVPLNDLVGIMDAVRKVEGPNPQFAFTDPKTGQKSQTNLVFPSVIFANVMGGS